MAIKCILFDADGVVINSDMFSVPYQKEHDISDDDMLPFFEGEFQNCIVGKADLIELVKPWLPKWKWKGSVDEFLQFWFKAEHKIDERVVKIIKKLRKKGIKCYLVTNQEKYRTQYMKYHMGFEELFEHVFSSADIGHKKPEKEFYEFVLNEIKNEHKIFPYEIMFFDDSKGHVKSAKRLDIHAYHYENFEDFKKLINPLLDDEALN